MTHLDAVYYDQDWNPLPQDEFAARLEKLVAEPAWIIEGNYASTLPIRLAAADTVILIDLPALTCLWGIVRRRLRYRGGQHHDVGVYDRSPGTSSATSGATAATWHPESGHLSPNTPPTPESSP